MPTLTAEQFKKRYGQEGLSQFSPQPIKPEKKQGFFSGVKDIISERGKNFGEILGKTGRGEINPLETGIRGTSQLVSTGFDIASKTIGAIAPEFIKEGVKRIGVEILETNTGKLGLKAIKAGADEWQEFKINFPRASENIESVVNISTILPVGKAGQIGVKGVTKFTKAGTEAAKKGTEAAGRGIALSGAVGEKVGQKVVSTLFSPTAPQAARTIAFQAKNKMLTRLGWKAKDIEKAPQLLADVIIKYNLSGLARGNIGARAKRVSDALWNNQVKPVVNNIKDKVSKTTIFNAMRKDIAKVADISQRKALLNAMEAMADDFKHVSNYSIKTLDKIKSEMRKRLPAKVWKGQDIAGDMNNIRLLFSGHARKIIRSKLPQEILDIYDDYGSLKTIAERGAKALTRGFDAGILGITSEAIRVLATPVATIGGAAISKAGTAIKKVGQALQK